MRAANISSSTSFLMSTNYPRPRQHANGMKGRDDTVISEYVTKIPAQDDCRYEIRFIGSLGLLHLYNFEEKVIPFCFFTYFKQGYKNFINICICYMAESLMTYECIAETAEAKNIKR